VRRQLSERRVHPREENAGDCSHGTKCNARDLMLALPIQRIHLAHFFQADLDQAARLARLYLSDEGRSVSLDIRNRLPPRGGKRIAGI
jgi:hypothetical protein